MHWIECRLFSSHLYCVYWTSKAHINNKERLFAILFIFNGFTCLFFFFLYKSKSFSLLSVRLYHTWKTVISSILWPSDRPTNQTTKTQSACIYIWNCNFMKAVNLKRDLYFFVLCMWIKSRKKKRERISLNELCSNDAKWRLVGHRAMCVSHKTHWVIMITMQQYDLIRHLNKILKGVFFDFFFRTAEETTQTQNNERKKKQKVIVLCLRIVFASHTFSPFLCSVVFEWRKERNKMHTQNWWAIEKSSKNIHKN